MITLKSDRELDLMRKSSHIVAQILDEVTPLVQPGISTLKLNEFAERRCEELGVIPSFKGYRGFPAAFCISLNHEVVHGIPSKKRVLRDGDIVSIDFGVICDGWHGDSARTYPVGSISKEAQQLLDVTRISLTKGIKECMPGNHVSDIGHAIQKYVEDFGYGVVKDFVGHGIGRALHEDPQVPNFGAKGRGALLKAGMVLAIEPMINAGGPDVEVLADGWTAITADSSLSAHFEHTVAITLDGPEILTVVAGELKHEGSCISKENLSEM